MDSHGSDHSAHGEGHGSGVHLPDPSAWPLIVGLAAMIAGAALIWWSNDRNSDFAGPLLGVGIAAIFVSVAGWAYEDGRMRKKAEEGHGAEPPPVRFSQVLTFAVAEGQLSSARGASGVIGAVEHSDLRDVEGFQDLRVTVSPSESGPSTVLVETTWRGREGIDAYEATRQTLLDTVNGYGDQIVPGSVQVFDMEVVRDTKDTSFKFSLGAAATVLGSLLVAGFAVGAGLNLFSEESTADGAAPTPTAVGPNPYTITARALKFDKTTLAAPPNTAVTFTLDNKDTALHNLAFYQSKGGAVIVAGPNIAGGKTSDVSFTTPGPGTYYFQCDIHPDTMTGTFTVDASAPPPAGAATPAAGGATTGPATLISTDNKFDKKELTAAAGQEFSVTLTNKGSALHNVSFYDAKGGKLLDPAAEGKIIKGGASDTVTFKAPAAGKYYFQCDVHPDQMSGDFVVK